MRCAPDEYDLDVRRGIRTTRVLAGLLAAGAVALAGCGESASPPPHSVALKTGGELASWAPDGRLIAAPDRDNKIQLIEPDGSVSRRLSAPGVLSQFVQCQCPLGWSGDGSEIHFLTRRHFDKRGVMVGSVRLADGRVQEAPLGVPGGDAAWSPRGWPLVFVSNSIAGYYGTSRKGPTPDLWRLDGLHARPRKILAEPGFELRPQFSPDGTRVLYVYKWHGRRSVWVVGADGSNPHPVATGFSIVNAAWSPDGTRLAVAGYQAHGRGAFLYVASPSGGAMRRVPGVSGVGAAVAWTPDGRWIDYSARDGEIWRVRPDGSGRRRIGRIPRHDVRRLLWSPRGDHLAYSAFFLDESD